MCVSPNRWPPPLLRPAEGRAEDDPDGLRFAPRGAGKSRQEPRLSQERRRARLAKCERRPGWGAFCFALLKSLASALPTTSSLECQSPAIFCFRERPIALSIGSHLRSDPPPYKRCRIYWSDRLSSFQPTTPQCSHQIYYIKISKPMQMKN